MHHPLLTYRIAILATSHCQAASVQAAIAEINVDKPHDKHYSTPKVIT